MGNLISKLKFLKTKTKTELIKCHKIKSLWINKYIILIMCVLVIIYSSINLIFDTLIIIQFMP